MTKLTCDARDCMNNSDGCCCMGDLVIGGKDAVNCQETYCKFYKVKQKGNVFTMGYAIPNPEIDLGCDAVNCRYNEGKKCIAQEVSIVRHNKTTNCKTFEEL